MASVITAGAQTSAVTVFGIIDLSVRSMKNGSSSVKQLGFDGQQSSRLGFRGVEDLGGGMSAGFWLEANVFADTGTVNPTKFWNRRSMVTLAGPWGEVRLGRDLPPSAWNLILFDPFATTPFGIPFHFTNVLGSGAQTVSRLDNGVYYHLPAGLGGVYGQVAVAAGEGAAGVKYSGARLGYAAGPFDAAVSYGETTGVGNYKYKTTSIGGSVKPGVGKLSGYVEAAEYRDRKRVNILIGYSVPFGPHQVKVSAARANASGGGTDADDATEYVAQYIYALSKRTALYGTVGRLNNKGKAAYALSTPPAAQAGQASTGYGIGMNHSF